MDVKTVEKGGGKMRRVVVLVSVALILSGCLKDPVSKSETNNPNITVETLFDYDGCRVYRFLDNGNYRYFARCGSSVSTSWNEQRRKVSVPMEINTLVK